MARRKLPDRRASETRKITFRSENDNERKILITIGFDDSGAPKEVFCADFKAGTTLHSIVMDACVLISRALQHGDTPAELAAAMCEGPSLIGIIAATVAECEGPRVIRVRPGRKGRRKRGGSLPVDPPRAPDAPAGAAAAMEYAS